ncbi:UNVERIFIED_CONTAM: hypothetical protein RMT77_015523 [Armadillidium vulgare]|nr:RNA-binding protein MEX3B [Armadillidium vulgare]
MPASSLFEMDRPTSTPSNALTSTMDDQRALQIALELSLLGISNESTVPTNEPEYVVSGLSEAERSRRSQNMTECVAVPSSEHVAEIVGRQGCKIKALRAKTNTYIKTPVRGEEPVFVVTGRKEDVAMARREILSAAEHFSQIRACRKNNLNGSMAPGPPTNVPGQITISVRVPYRVVGLVVGPKGATIKRIQQQSHTYIVTPSRDKEPVFEVTGLPDSVEHARKEIEAHIAMRTGALLDAEETSNAVANAVSAVTYASVNGKQSEFGNGASSHSLDNLFSNSELMSSLYKLNQSTFGSFNGGLSSLGGNSVGGSSLNALNSLNSTSTMNTLNNLGGTSSTLGSTLSSLPPLSDINYLLGDSNSLLSSKTMENSLFPPLGTAVSAQSKLELNGALGSLYSVDEGLGSMGSSMGSSPSFDPNPSSLWGDIGRNMASSLSSVSNSNGGSLSSNLSLTRRSSSASGQSPPSSRLSPTLELHPSARRISSDPSVNLAPGSFSSMLTSNNTSGSSASTPELALGSVQQISSSLGAAGTANCSSGTSSPTMEKRCRSCGDNPVVAALVPCGHNLFCMDCATRLASESGKCTICLEEVSQAIRIFS